MDESKTEFPRRTLQQMHYCWEGLFPWGASETAGRPREVRTAWELVHCVQGQAAGRHLVLTAVEPGGGKAILNWGYWRGTSFSPRGSEPVGTSPKSPGPSRNRCRSSLPPAVPGWLVSGTQKCDIFYKHRNSKSTITYQSRTSRPGSCRASILNSQVWVSATRVLWRQGAYVFFVRLEKLIQKCKECNCHKWFYKKICNRPRSKALPRSCPCVDLETFTSAWPAKRT